MRTTRPVRHVALLAVLATGISAPAAAGTDARTDLADSADASGCARPLFAEPVPIAADGALHLDRCGALFYADPPSTQSPRDARAPRDKRTLGRVAVAAEASETTRPGATASVPLDRTFTLASNPGAPRTIWLDFTGDTVTGTAWNDSYGSTIDAEPYSLTPPASTDFTAAELTEIQKAWQVVAEDYAPFDVNVTLADPGADAISRSSDADTTYGTRVLVTSHGPVHTACSCGGLGYMDVFDTSGPQHAYYQPAWVFTKSVGTSGPVLGESASHEAGHNFGLEHDATSGSAYYAGSPPWAPIMGSGGAQPISQFSRGEYADASTSQDDLAVVAAGAPLRADDHGDTSDTATDLGGVSSFVDGIITTRSDVDAFRVTAAGSTSIEVAPAPGLPNLDIELTVLDVAGRKVARIDPSATRVTRADAAGLGATWSVTAPATGTTYTLLVDGVGTGDPRVAGRYSDYGSLGHYRVSLATGGHDTAAPLAFHTGARLPRARKNRAYTTDLRVSGGESGYVWNVNRRAVPPGLRLRDHGHTATLRGRPTRRGTYRFRISVRDAAGLHVRRTFRLTVR